ncbi:DUF5683 domain-containing protein [Methanohalobium sp.]|uniref:DUF5683 domain-containing protein n=1 Tax=Methanohalobium sp. TaxID=2837493 RepID=UPI0025CC4EF5|nr:DUF5683 domain-containing protein [Methanohalobium sp.]
MDNTNEERLKNPLAALGLSLIFPGLGQIYNQQVKKGQMFFVIAIILIVTMFAAVGFVLYPIFWIYNMYDAYTDAVKMNSGEIQTG